MVLGAESIFGGNVVVFGTLISEMSFTIFNVSMFVVAIIPCVPVRFTFMTM
jgi:hypothetical protein